MASARSSILNRVTRAVMWLAFRRRAIAGFRPIMSRMERGGERALPEWLSPAEDSGAVPALFNLPRLP